MRTLLTLAADLVVLAGCGSDGDTTASDPAGSSSEMPTQIPAAPGPVRTLTIATVMDTGSPELCLGPVAPSQVHHGMQSNLHFPRRAGHGKCRFTHAPW